MAAIDIIPQHSMGTAATMGQSDALAKRLKEKNYVTERINPSRTSIDYLSNKDLRDAVLLLSQNCGGLTLDYGAGGSPYRDVLSNLRPYRRADIPGDETLDLVLDASGRLPDEPSDKYDVILSTQVLEHVPDAGAYLSEAYRLLKPGGSLLLTTHGFMAEHGCPYDFGRWTADGLARAVTRAGFVVEENYKLTLDIRACLYLLNYAAFCLFIGTGWREKIARLFRRSYRIFFVRVVNWIGDFERWERMLLNGSPRRFRHHQSLYIGIALRATKPPLNAPAAGD